MVKFYQAQYRTLYAHEHIKGRCSRCYCYYHFTDEEKITFREIKQFLKFSQLLSVGARIWT